MMALPIASGVAQDSDFEPPGTEEAAEVEKANAEIDVVYKELMDALDEEGKTSLQEAERAWVKWRDAEAMLSARAGGAVGGSALRVDFLSAQAKLIRERTQVLKEYLKLAREN